MSTLIEHLMAFIQASPTSWHAVQTVGDCLAEKGFTPLEGGEPWSLELGQGYFVERGGSICCFRLPPTPPTTFRMIAAHTDSPGLKLKPLPDVWDSSYHQLSTEMYGTPLMNSWLNRDLYIAGKVVVENYQGKIEEHLVALTDEPMIIPQTAIHLDRAVNERGLTINPQEHLRPILGITPEGEPQLEPLLRKEISFQHLLAFELFMVPLDPPRQVGIRGELLASYRLDNLVSCHAAIVAIVEALPTTALPMVFLYNHEEIGSLSAEGADSSFTLDVLHRLRAFYQWTEEAWQCVKARGMIVSADVAHAYHPNDPTKSDPHHSVIPGKGVVIKCHAYQNYATSAIAIATVRQLCRSHTIPYQFYVPRSDMKGGGTIGPILAAKLGVQTVDVGAPVVSMHSIREIMGIQDHVHMCQFLKTVLEL